MNETSRIPSECCDIHGADFADQPCAAGCEVDAVEYHSSGDPVQFAPERARPVRLRDVVAVGEVGELPLLPASPACVVSSITAPAAAASIAGIAVLRPAVVFFTV